jgi:hypothetical protein
LTLGPAFPRVARRTGSTAATEERRAALVEADAWGGAEPTPYSRAALAISASFESSAWSSCESLN